MDRSEAKEVINTRIKGRIQKSAYRAMRKCISSVPGENFFSTFIIPSP
jgi:hypothetical protein